MSNIPKFAFILFFVFTIFGCATVEKMESLENPAATLETGKSIFLLSGNLKNNYKTEHLPRLSSISVERMEDGEWIVFTIPKTTYELFKDMLKDDLYMAGFKNDSEDPAIGHSFLAQIALEPGIYTLRFINSERTAFITKGSFNTPIHEIIDVSVPGIYYLGCINAVVRERTGNEFKAGSSVPLLDQSVVGASGGTFDVEITDQWEIDEPLFLRQYPMLEGSKITKAILPPFDRDKAQKFWEEH